MGPVQWWWRTWSKVIDPSREQELVGALVQAEEQQQRADRLASELTGRESTIGALEQRAVKAEGELRRVQARVTELEEHAAQLQSRVDELRGVEADVDKLRRRLKDADAEIDSLRSRAENADADRAKTDKLRTRLEKADAEIDSLRSRAENADADRAETKRLRARVKDLESREQPADTGDGSDAASAPADTGDAPDVSGAPAVLGRPVDLDDLTVVEGIGPKIAGLLGDAGIATWRELSDAKPDRLRSILQEAGPRYRVHDPGTWPRQAALLADGKWQEFKDLRAEVRSR